jgi:hypothetical protein
MPERNGLLSSDVEGSVWWFNRRTGKLELAEGILDRPGFKTSPEKFKTSPNSFLTSGATINGTVSDAASAAAVIATGKAKRAAALRSFGGGGEQREPGYDPNQGAGVSDLSFLEGLMKFGPMALSFAGGPAGLGLLAARRALGFALDTDGRNFESSLDADEVFDARAMREFESETQETSTGGDSRDTSTDSFNPNLGGSAGDFEGVSFDDRDGGSTIGDIGGSRVDDSGPSGARDEIGTRDDGGGGGDRDRDDHQSESEARGGGDYGEGRYHKGGTVTDHNPRTRRNNMRITAQEGEIVMSREAVGLLSPGFFARINQAAQKRKR